MIFHSFPSTASSSNMIRSFSLASKFVGNFRTCIGLFTRNYHGSDTPNRWMKPKVGWIKLNVDGSSKDATGKASIGGAYRDHEGVFLCGYAQSIGEATSSIAELVAAKRGIQLALENGWRSIWLEGDAKAVIDLLMNDSVTVKSPKDIMHARDILVMIRRLNEFNATHICRKGNRVAHKFAEIGHEMAKPQIWRDIPPGEVLRYLDQDVQDSVPRRKG